MWRGRRARATARKPQWNIKMCFISPFYSITFFLCFSVLFASIPFVPSSFCLALSPSPPSYLFLHFAKTNSFLKFIFNLFFHKQASLSSRTSQSSSLTESADKKAARGLSPLFKEKNQHEVNFHDFKFFYRVTSDRECNNLGFWEDFLVNYLETN